MVTEGIVTRPRISGSQDRENPGVSKMIKTTVLDSPSKDALGKRRIIVSNSMAMPSRMGSEVPRTMVGYSIVVSWLA